MRVERAVMGMPVAIEIRAGAPDPAQAAERAFAWLDWVDATFSTYRPASEISRIAAGELAPRDAHPLVRRVLARCERLRRVTHGAFDAHATGRLDPSGLVKGWAVDRAVALLTAAGARDLCVDAGGDVSVRGGPWRIGIRHPHRHDRLAAVVRLENGAVATSATYERGNHIVDPRTGRAATGLASVTVVGPALGTADAYATAAFAMGAGGPAWTTTLAGHGALSITSDDRVLSTPGFNRFRAAMRADTAPAR